LYVKRGNNCITYIALFVDDFFVFSDSPQDVSKLRVELERCFKVRDLGLAHECLGMRLKRDAGGGVVSLDQELYCLKVLEKFGMSEYLPISTPMDPGLQLKRTEACSRDYPY